MHDGISSTVHVDTSLEPTPGKSPAPVVFLELCAGSAALSAAAQKCGFQVFPVDFHRNRFSPKCRILEVDMSHPESAGLLNSMIHEMNPIACHMGLPCGTCSRAREQAIPAAKKARGAPEPVPLRDAQALLGLKNLSKKDQQKVDAANRVYRTAVQVMLQCYLCGVIVVIENPVRSWLWPLLALLVKQTCNKGFIDWYFSLHEIVYAACMHGGKRDKYTKLLSSTPCLQPLACECDGGHEHLPWGVQKSSGQWAFATAAEAEYPALLCSRYIELLATLVDKHRLEFTTKQFRLDTLAKASNQAIKHKQLITEFSAVQTVDHVAKDASCKILRTVSTNDGGEKRKQFEVGIFRSYEEHVQCALQLPHPVESTEGVPDDLKRAAFNVVTKGMYEVARLRNEAMKDCLKMANDLKLDEKALHDTMDPSLAKITVRKKILLFERLLQEVNFEDMNVVSFLRDGVPLTGWEPESSLFAKRWNPPITTVECLDKSAKWQRKSVMTRPFGDEERDAAPTLWDETMSEVELGFLEGPYYDEDAVTSKLGTEDWSMTPRFILFQGEERKPRVIDNFKASNINDAFGSSSYLDLHDTDFLSCFLVFLGELHTGGDEVRVRLSTGEILTGWKHPSVKGEVSLVGRGVDLSKAYKQVGILPSSLHHSVLGVRKTCGTWAYFVSRSLPFGASASVFAFNKLTRALWAILVRKFNVLASVFYDDFPVVEYSDLSHGTTILLNTLLDLLGWQHAVVGKKATPFGPVMSVLGVEFHLSTLFCGVFRVQNKSGRVERIVRMLRSCRDAGGFSSHDISVLQGLLNFAGRFFMGRAIKFPTYLLSNYEQWRYDKSQVAAIVDSTCEMLEALQPRIVRCFEVKTPLIVYTDAAFEGGVATWGAILFDRHSGLTVVHWGSIDPSLISAWQALSGEQIISQAEAYAVLVLRFRYSDTLMNRPSLWFIDNEAARFSLIKGASPSLSMFLIVREISFIDASQPTGAWYERVASLSNIADLPSRGEHLKACELVRGTPKGDILLSDAIMRRLQTRSFDELLAR